MKASIPLLLILILFCNILTYAQQEKLPNISLENLNGKYINIQSYSIKEHIIVLNFWATWCAPCIKELNAISDVYDDWQDETGVELIAVSTDDQRSLKRVRPMVNGNNWEFNVLLDKNQKLKRALNIPNVPYTLVLYKGKIVYRHIGYTPGAENDLYEVLLKYTKIN